MVKRFEITSFTLKLVAIIAMTLDHIGLLFSGMLPQPVEAMLVGCGGITYPIMAFLISEGYQHTSNIRRYAARLFVFALLSQIPYFLFLGTRLNIMFTLLLGLGLIHLLRKRSNPVLFGVAFIVASVASLFCSWTLIGPGVVLLFAVLRKHKGGVSAACWITAGAAIVMTAAFSQAQSQLLLAATISGYVAGGIVNSAFLSAYDGKRGRPLKYFFYIYYPAHIAVLGAIATYLSSGSPIPALPWF